VTDHDYDAHSNPRDKALWRSLNYKAFTAWTAWALAVVEEGEQEGRFYHEWNRRYPTPVSLPPSSIISMNFGRW
jgi:hypothetical protein